MRKPLAAVTGIFGQQNEIAPVAGDVIEIMFDAENTGTDSAMVPSRSYWPLRRMISALSAVSPRRYWMSSPACVMRL